MEDVISVVIPVYNVARYLNRCLDSVVNQTYRNLEIILVDDGSTDDCPDICDEWAQRDSRIKVIHKINSGAGMARNTGIENATGKYICFFDSDDFIDLHILEKAYQLSEKENSDITIFGMAKIDGKGRVLKQVIPRAPKFVYSGEEVQKVFLPDLINYTSEKAQVKNVCLSVWVNLFRMDLIKQSEWRLVSERDFFSEDSYSLMVLYQHIGRVAILPEIGYYYCYNETSLTHHYRADRYEQIRIFYRKAVELQQALGYDDVVKERLGRLYLGFVMGAIKQIAASAEPVSERIGNIKAVVLDETMQSVLHTLDIDCYNVKVRMLLSAMRRKMYHLVYILTRVHVAAEK